MPVMLLAEHTLFKEQTLLAECGTAPPPTGQPNPARPGKPRQPCGPQTADDTTIGMALTARWMLITGRHLHQHPLLHTLPPEELIDFWADDYTTQIPGKSSLPPARSWMPPCR